MSDIPPDVVARMMVKCARRCCICRRFRPTKLQVHHIRERAQGGGNEEDNLIVTCLSCHSDVHTKVPFARRFSEEELKGHRDALTQLAAEGKLPLNDTDDADLAVERVIAAVRLHTPRPAELTLEAVEILLRAASDGTTQGRVITAIARGGLIVQCEGHSETTSHADHRRQAKLKHGLQQLVDGGLLEARSPTLYELTYDGYLVADDIMSSQRGREPHANLEDQAGVRNGGV